MKADPSNTSFDPVAHHKPYVAPETIIPEFTASAVIVGTLLGIIFGASSLYLVLKVGMTVSASIPIAVLSITLFRVFTGVWPFKLFFRRNATILENNMVQTTGSAGESIAFGVGVTMPALLILGYNLELTRVMLVACLGGLLGILMMIPLRRAFIVRQHGRLKYPEGTACADVLIVGEQGGSNAATVFLGLGVAFAYKAMMSGLKLWHEIPLRMSNFFNGASVSAEISPELLGVGYIIGTRTSCIMVAGGILAYWVLVPMLKLAGDSLTVPIYPAQKLIKDMSLGELRNNYILYIGAGAVAAGGIISMFRSLPLIVGSIGSGLRDLSTRENGAGVGGTSSRVLRTDRDLSMKFVLLGTLGLILAIWAAPMLNMNALGAVLIVVFGFLFVTVSSRLTGEIGSSSNPISGMTVATLLLTCLIFLGIGWTTKNDKLTALSIAGIVCIAASNGGTTSQDLKTGYLVGGTPRFQQIGILIGALSSALVIGVTLLVLNDAGTIFSQKDLPNVSVDVSQLTDREGVSTFTSRWLGNSPGVDDPKTYWVLQAGAGQYPGIPVGKYLVDDLGKIHYFVDPAINGKLTKRDDGTDAPPRYDAPKAFLMSSIIDGILSRQLPWSLVLLGVSIAIVLELSGVNSLPFAVGVYLPLSTSSPIFVGGMVRYFADRWTRRTEAEAEMSPGVLLASGFIAGGTICGIFTGILPLSENLVKKLDVGERWLGAYSQSHAYALIPFAVLVGLLLWVGARRSRGPLGPLSP